MQRLCADFLLALLPPGADHPLVDGPKLRAGLAGAAIAAAVLDGQLHVGPDGALQLTAATGDGDIWSEVLHRCDAMVPKKAVARCGAAEDFRDRGGRLRDATVATLVEAGAIEDRSTRVVGIPLRRYALVRRPDRDAVMTRLTLALDGAPENAHDAVLVILLHAVGALRRLFPDRDRRTLDAGVSKLRSAGWVADAVSEALRDLDLAVMAAVVGTTVVIAGS